MKPYAVTIQQNHTRNPVDNAIALNHTKTNGANKSATGPNGMVMRPAVPKHIRNACVYQHELFRSYESCMYDPVGFAKHVFCVCIVYDQVGVEKHAPVAPNAKGIMFGVFANQSGWVCFNRCSQVRCVCKRNQITCPKQR